MHPVWRAIGLLALGACAAVSGLDDFRVSAVSAGGAAGSGTSEGGTSDGGTAMGGSTGGAQGGGGDCEGTTPCFNPQNQGSVACQTDGAVASCVPAAWDYCSCSAGPIPQLIFEPASGVGPLQAITLIADMGDGPYNLSFHNANCVGAPAECDGCGVKIYRWTDFSLGGTLTSTDLDVRLWGDDENAPCNEPDGGTILIQTSYVVP